MAKTTANRTAMISAKVPKPLADAVQTWADEHGVTQPEAVQLLVQAGLEVDAGAGVPKSGRQRRVMIVEKCSHPISRRLGNWCPVCLEQVKAK